MLHKLQLLTDRHGNDDSMDNELAVGDDSDPEDNTTINVVQIL